MFPSRKLIIPFFPLLRPRIIPIHLCIGIILDSSFSLVLCINSIWNPRATIFTSIFKIYPKSRHFLSFSSLHPNHHHCVWDYSTLVVRLFTWFPPCPHEAEWAPEDVGQMTPLLRSKPIPLSLSVKVRLQCPQPCWSCSCSSSLLLLHHREYLLFLRPMLPPHLQCCAFASFSYKNHPLLNIWVPYSSAFFSVCSDVTSSWSPHLITLLIL